MGPVGAVDELQEHPRHLSLASDRRRGVKDVEDLLNGVLLRSGDGHLSVRVGDHWQARIQDWR